MKGALWAKRSVNLIVSRYGTAEEPPPPEEAQLTPDPRIVEARIEIPMGSRNKYEVDEKTDRIKLDRVLYSSVYYSAEYGFAEDTRYLDGDPLDILVFTSAPTFPGCYVDCRIIDASFERFAAEKTQQP